MAPGLVAETQPQPSGVMWLLSASSSTSTLDELDLATGQMVRQVPESADVVTVAGSRRGVLATGSATATTGSVALQSAFTGAPLASIAVGAPVHDVAFGPDGTTLYVLEGSSTSMSVAVIDSQTQMIEKTVAVALDTTSVVPGPGGAFLWASERNGDLEEIELAIGRVIARFSIGGPARDIVSSPNGNILYVLKGSVAVDNVAVIAQATEVVIKVLPAPANCVGIALSPNGRTLYEAVGTPTLGAVQTFPVSG